MVNKGKLNKEEAYLKFSVTFKMHFACCLGLGCFIQHKHSVPLLRNVHKGGQTSKRTFFVMNHILCYNFITVSENIILCSIN